MLDKPEDGEEVSEEWEILFSIPEKVDIVLARYLCALVLHMTLQHELKTGMNMMKFALNHEFMFTNYKAAFFCGFVKAISIILVEFVNLLLILCNDSIVEIVLNFVALTIIAEFDDYYFSSLREDEYKAMLLAHNYKCLLKIRFTTSQRTLDMMQQTFTPERKSVEDY